MRTARTKLEQFRARLAEYVATKPPDYELSRRAKKISSRLYLEALEEARRERLATDKQRERDERDAGLFAFEPAETPAPRRRRA